MNLLPPNASPIENALADSLTALSAVPVPLRTLWNPDTCPLPQLPWLAWAFSVDVWDTAWSESQKRAVVKAAFFVHQRKGTLGAVRASLAAIGWSVDVVEWFVEGAAPYTFRVEAQLDARGIAPGLFDEIERLALAAKNTRSHLTSVRLVHTSPSPVYVGGAVLAAEIVTIDPWQQTLLESAAQLRIGGAVVAHEIVTLSPQVH